MKFLEVTTGEGKVAIRPQYVHRIIAADPNLPAQFNATVVTSDQIFEVLESYAELIQQLEGIGE